MPGGIPSGSDPTGYDPFPFSIVGDMVGDLHSRDEATVRSQLGSETKANPALKDNSDSVFAGLNPNLGLAGAILKAALQTVVGVPLSIIGGGVGAVLGAFGGIPASQITDSATANLVTNPQFNVDLTGWTAVGAWVQDSTQGHAAQGSAKIVADGTTKTLTGQRIPVVQGNGVTIDFWYKMVSGVGVASPVRIGLNLLDGNGLLLSTQAVGAGVGSGTLDWTHVTGPVYAVGSSVKYVQPVITIANTMTAGTVWCDDVSVTKSGKIPQNLVEGLEDTLGGLLGVIPNLLLSLGGLIPAFIINGDGTADPNPLSNSVTVNGDGTATYTPDGLTQLFIIGNGIAMNVFDFLNAFASGVLPGLQNNLYPSGAIAPQVDPNAVPASQLVFLPGQVKAVVDEDISTYVDTSNIADNGKWIQRRTNTLKVVSGVATPTTVGASSWSMATHISDMETNDHYIRVKMSHAGVGGEQVALFISSNNTDWDIYAIWAPGNPVWIAKQNGNYTSFDSGRVNVTPSAGTPGWAANDWLEFKRQGNLYTVSNITSASTLISWADTTNTYIAVDYQHRDIGAAIMMNTAGHGFTALKGGDL